MSSSLRLTLLACLAVSSSYVAFVGFPNRPSSNSRPATKFLDVSTASSSPSAAPVETAEVQASMTQGLRALAALCAALLLAFAPMQDAQAARSGGRMGGGRAPSFRAPPRAMPQSRAGPSVGSSVYRGGPNVSIGVAPMFAPSPFGFGGGFGFGMPLFPPLGFGMPLGGGPTASDQMLQNQQRNDERQIDAQKQQIQDLERQINELKASKK
eukprot:TRINITY_DN1175_c3_g1_i1.p1 TRINITY_DN1175_c3_g1~~TRINITY_DN1175_c3_g1_i1.p1  ORF type:complete len:211 (+),score=41.03 TRINITY_DN1175_c3_g1_i1:135-767(+)